MLRATAGKILPTTITDSLPRPSWYTENLGTKGTNLVRKELGLPLVESLGAAPKFSLLRTKQ